MCILLIFISQAGTIQDTGLSSDAAKHGICWYAGVDSPGSQSLITATPIRIGTLHVPKAVFSSTLHPAEKVNMFLLVLRVEKCCTHRSILSSFQPPSKPFENYSGGKGETDNKEEKLQGRKRMIDAGREGSRGCRNRNMGQAIPNAIVAEKR